MLKKISMASGLAGCLVAMAACSGATEVKSDPPAATKPAESQQDAQQAGAQQEQAKQDAIVAVARAALRGTGVDDAVYRSMKPAEWSDSSLGCPRPGVSYMQVITSGHVVQFETPNGPRTVHVAGENAVICAQQLTGVPKRSLQPVRASVLEAMVKSAREDLAARLDLPVDSVRVVSSVPFTWDGGSFNCGRPPVPGAPDTVTGYKIQLAAAGNQYVYHTDYKTASACPLIERE